MELSQFPCKHVITSGRKFPFEARQTHLTSLDEQLSSPDCVIHVCTHCGREATSCASASEKERRAASTATWKCVVVSILWIYFDPMRDIDNVSVDPELKTGRSNLDRNT